MQNDEMRFDGSKLKAKREAARKTQTEVAEFLEITPQSYGEMERGLIGPSSTTLAKLCIFFDCLAQDFFDIPAKFLVAA